RKDYPPVKDWPRFSGEGEYNHLEWIEWIDNVQDELSMPDSLITCKLAIIMINSARSWFISKRRSIGKASWPKWRELIKENFGTPLWKRKMGLAFDKDRFRNEHRNKPVAWLQLQRKRLNAAWPFLTTSEQIDKILGVCHGDIEHAVQSRIRDMENFEAFANIFEEVVTNTSAGKMYKDENKSISYSKDKKEYRSKE
ncbi:hypothetical protein CROQUDRAFT_20315, partial [Cronartium quercuum f. sp. fusiforme G11]